METKFEERVHIRRYEKTNVTKRLSELKGERFDKYREAWNKAEKEHIAAEAPLYIELGINSDCNLRCKMCARNFDATMNNKHINMPMSMIDKIVEQAKEFSLPSILVGQDSECLLHPNFCEIITKLREINPVDFFVISNGTLLTEKMSSFLVESGVDRLEISVDAANNSSYQKIRGGNSQFLNAI